MAFGVQAAQVQGTPYLTNMTLNLAIEQGFLATRFASVLPVVAESTSFWVKSFAYGKLDGDISQDGTAPAQASSPPLATGTFTAFPHSHGAILPKRTLDAAMVSPTGFKQIEELYAGHPALVLSMNLEKALHTLLTTTGTYFSSAHYTNLGASPALQFDNYATSNPMNTVITYCRVIQARSGIARRLLTILMGRSVYDALLQHPALADRIKYIRSALVRDVNESDVAAFFGVKDVLVGDVLEVTSAPGAASEVSSFTWGKDLWIGYVDPAPTQMTGTAASFLIPSVTASMNGAVGAPWSIRAIPILDPLGTKYIAEGIYGVAAGKVTGEGVRTAAWIQNAVANT